MVDWFPEWDHIGTPWDNPENYEKHNPVQNKDFTAERIISNKSRTLAQNASPNKKRITFSPSSTMNSG